MTVARDVMTARPTTISAAAPVADAARSAIETSGRGRDSSA